MPVARISLTVEFAVEVDEREQSDLLFSRSEMEIGGYFERLTVGYEVGNTVFRLLAVGYGADSGGVGCEGFTLR